MKFILIWILYSDGHIHDLGKITNLASLKSCKEKLKNRQVIVEFLNKNNSKEPKIELRGTCVKE
jgi:hypothetical protein